MILKRASSRFITHNAGIPFRAAHHSPRTRFTCIRTTTLIARFTTHMLSLFNYIRETSRRIWIRRYAGMASTHNGMIITFPVFSMPWMTGAGGYPHEREPLEQHSRSISFCLHLGLQAPHGGWDKLWNQGQAVVGRIIRMTIIKGCVFYHRQVISFSGSVNIDLYTDR